MKSTFLICAVVACCELALGQAANYSLWPRRPAAIQDALALAQQHRAEEAVSLLAPYLREPGIVGREARHITGQINIPRYLSRRHPNAFVYTVKKGDNFANIAARHKCPSDLIYLINGVVEPSKLQVGQKLVLVPMNLALYINESLGEISVWDGENVVVTYKMTAPVPMSASASAPVQTCRVKQREGFDGDMPVPRRSIYYPSSDRVISLDNGRSIAAKQQVAGSCYRMEQRELNELALLLNEGAPVYILKDDAWPAPAAATETSPIEAPENR